MPPGLREQTMNDRHKNMHRIRQALLLTLTLMLLPALGTAATKEEMGVVINLSGKQRMLTQKMSKETLLIARGVYVESTRKELAASASLFNKTLKGLKDGDAELGLPPTEEPAIRAQLDKVFALWSDFDPHILAVLKGDTGTKQIKAIAEKNLPLLGEMNKAVQMYADSTDSGIDPGLAATINLAGKQRMLTQKMTKELFLVANDIDPEANQAALKKTAALFERTLTGLVEGDAELGLPGTVAPDIIEQLGLVRILWEEYKPILFAGDTSEDGLAIAAEVNQPLLEQMNIAVKMYEESAGAETPAVKTK